MPYRSLYVFILALFFTGCAKNNIDYKKQLQSKDTKISTLKTLSAKKIKVNEPFHVSLGNKESEAILQNKRKVFASKLFIPKMDKPYSIDIVSSSMKGFFAPKIYLLSQSNKVVRSVKAKDLTFDRGYFKGTVFINNAFDKIRYMVVTQDLHELHSKYKVNNVTATQVAIPVYTGTGVYTMFYNHASGDQKATVTNAYGGNVKLTLNVYQPKVLGQED